MKFLDVGNLVLNGIKKGSHNITAMAGKNSMADELLEVRRNCKDNVIYAQDDLDKWNAEQALKQMGE